MADPERGLWGRSNFKEAPQFLKSKQISPVYALTSKKVQTFVRVILMSSYIEKYVNFVSFSGTLGACPRLSHLDSPLKVVATRPRLIGICL